MGKSFKDLGVVKFLTKKLPKAAGSIVNNFADVATGNKSVLQAVGDVIDGHKDQLSADEIQQAYKLAQLDEQRFEAKLKDTADARQMQEDAINSSDPLVRRYLYYMTSGIILVSFIILGMLFFIHIPKENSSVVFTTVGVLFGSGITQILNFFYGSSQGSKNKESLVSQILKK